MGSHGLAWAHTAAALRRDADEGLLPPLPCGAVPDYKAGAWEEPAKKAEPEGAGIFIGNLPRTVTHAVLTELCVQTGWRSTGPPRLGLDLDLDGIQLYARRKGEDMRDKVTRRQRKALARDNKREPSLAYM